MLIYLLITCVACTEDSKIDSPQDEIIAGALNEDTTHNQISPKKNLNKGMVARVNSEGITQEDFDTIYEQRVRTYRLKKKPVPERLKRTYRSAVLQKLINEKLIDQYMKSINIQLTADEERNAVESYKKRLNGEKGFQRYIENSGKTEADVYDRIKRDALINKTLSQEESTQVSTQELREYYDKYRDTRYTEKAQVRASHILVTVAKNASKKLIKKRKKDARSIYKKVRKDKDEFYKVAKTQSGDLTSKLRGGDLGFFHKSGVSFISKSFEKAVSKLKEGDISDLIRTEQGFHIVKLTDRQKAQIKVSHILLKTPEAQKTAKSIYQRALQEDFASLSKEYSQDESTRIRGGDLGYIYQKSRNLYGDDFRKECLALDAGEVKGNIKTQAGIHIIKGVHKRKERLRASHILIKVDRKASKKRVEKARKKAQMILDELRKHPKSAASRFVRLAKKYSEDHSKDRGGDLGVFYSGGQPKISYEFEKAAFGLKVNETSPPVRSHLGWHVIQLIDKKPSKIRSFEDAKSEILERLRKKKTQFTKSTLIKNLRIEAKIEELIQTKPNHLQRLKQIKLHKKIKNGRLPQRVPIHLNKKKSTSKKTTSRIK